MNECKPLPVMSVRCLMPMMRMLSIRSFMGCLMAVEPMRRVMPRGAVGALVLDVRGGAVGPCSTRAGS